MSAQALMDAAAYAAENGISHSEAIWEINYMDDAVPLIVACPCCPADNPADAIFHGTGGWPSVEACYGPIADDVFETLSARDKAGVLRARAWHFEREAEQAERDEAGS